MRIRLSDIREESFSWNETRPLAAGSFEDPRLAGLGEVSWRGELSWAAPEFLLRMSVDYSRRLVCDRCLEEFDDQVHEEIALLVQHGPRGGERNSNWRAPISMFSKSMVTSSISNHC